MIDAEVRAEEPVRAAGAAAFAAADESQGGPGAFCEATLVDTFRVSCERGRVGGSRSESGHIRRVLDREGVIGVDHGALRIGQMVHPGWGRHAIAYGPFERRPGLVFACQILNGHNTSEAYELASLARQVRRWCLGSGSDSYLRRVRGVLRAPARESPLAKVRRWHTHRRGAGGPMPFKDNLAVGWFGSPDAADPPGEGRAFVVHATKQDNGELRTAVCGAALPAFRGLQNVPVCYVVAHREAGVMYYAGSLEGAHGLGELPWVRPIALDPSAAPERLYAGVHQGALGEIGFSVDTRVYGVRVQEVGAWGRWYGTAHAADSLRVRGPLAGREAERGGAWGSADAGRGSPGAALLFPEGPSGLVHLMVKAGAAAGLVWRARDGESCWSARLEGGEVLVEVREGGVAETVCRGAAAVSDGESASLQVYDDGREIRVSVNGQRVHGAPIVDERLCGERGVGVWLPPSGAGEGSESGAAWFEAHPRLVRLPEELCFERPWDERGAAVRIHDAFDGPAGDLQGRAVAGAAWRRELGPGAFELTGRGGLRVAGSIARPFPQRTLYTAPWDDPGFAEVRVAMIPPGTARFQGHRGRSGIVMHQDPDHYILWNLWMDDGFGASSLSTFFCIRGFDDIYDAVWTNLGSHRITYARPFELAIAFDGARYLVRINGEPVLYRALSDVYPKVERIDIRRVGLQSNWEWGTDTGTEFRDFTVRGRSRRAAEPG